MRRNTSSNSNITNQNLPWSWSVFKWLWCIWWHDLWWVEIHVCTRSPLELGNGMCFSTPFTKPQAALLWPSIHPITITFIQQWCKTLSIPIGSYWNSASRSQLPTLQPQWTLPLFHTYSATSVATWIHWPLGKWKIPDVMTEKSPFSKSSLSELRITTQVRTVISVTNFQLSVKGV